MSKLAWPDPELHLSEQRRVGLKMTVVPVPGLFSTLFPCQLGPDVSLHRPGKGRSPTRNSTQLP